MNEEEKKAIKRVIKAIEDDKKSRIVTIYDEKPLFRDVLQMLLNLINKQQKEIEELKEENRKLRKCHLRYEEMTGIDLLLEE